MTTQYPIPFLEKSLLRFLAECLRHRVKEVTLVADDGIYFLAHLPKALNEAPAGCALRREGLNLVCHAIGCDPAKDDAPVTPGKPDDIKWFRFKKEYHCGTSDVHFDYDTALFYSWLEDKLADYSVTDIEPSSDKIIRLSLSTEGTKHVTTVSIGVKPSPEEEAHFSVTPRQAEAFAGETWICS